ncbi:MAG: RNA polymerase sigma factor, partial [Limisphaerales bacterium]
MTAMANDDASSIQTRPSLLNRLKTGDDTASWQEFYRIYGKLARDFAIQAGLTDAEANEVVQETAIAMARHLPEYRYDPKVCRFKTWLLNLTRWRVQDQLRKRRKQNASNQESPPGPHTDETARTPTLQRVPDQSAPDLDALFENEWRKGLFAAALDCIKPRFSLKQFQIFDLLVLKEWPAADVAKSLGVSLANVYVTRHRIAAAIKKETKRLERLLERSAKRQS